MIQNRRKGLSLHWWLFGVQMTHRAMGNIALWLFLGSSREIQHCDFGFEDCGGGSSIEVVFR
jgi:hypothetical protein